MILSGCLGLLNGAFCKILLLKTFRNQPKFLCKEMTLWHLCIVVVAVSGNSIDMLHPICCNRWPILKYCTFNCVCNCVLFVVSTYITSHKLL